MIGLRADMMRRYFKLCWYSYSTYVLLCFRDADGGGIVLNKRGGLLIVTVGHAV